MRHLTEKCFAVGDASVETLLVQHADFNLHHIEPTRLLVHEMHHILRCQGLTDCSDKRQRTVSRENSSCSVRSTISSANSSRVQRAGPAGESDHATATSNASSRPVSLRLAPTRGASLNAAARPCSTNRRLARYTVDVPTPTVAAIVASPRPCSAASRICIQSIMTSVQRYSYLCTMNLTGSRRLCPGEWELGRRSMDLAGAGQPLR